jgi:hypothetical protein
MKSWPQRIIGKPDEEIVPSSGVFVKLVGVVDDDFGKV